MGAIVSLVTKIKRQIHPAKKTDAQMDGSKERGVGSPTGLGLGRKPSGKRLTIVTEPRWHRLNDEEKRGALRQAAAWTPLKMGELERIAALFEVLDVDKDGALSQLLSQVQERTGSSGESALRLRQVWPPRLYGTLSDMHRVCCSIVGALNIADLKQLHPGDEEAAELDMILGDTDGDHWLSFEEFVEHRASVITAERHGIDLPRVRRK